MNMKRIGAIILSAAVAASIVAGCSQTTETPGTAAAPVSETTAAATLPSETTTAETEYKTPESAEELYGDQIMNYLDHQYYFNGQPVPVWESNYYIMETFHSLSQYAGSADFPVTTLGCLDLAAEYPGEEFATYGDYFIKQAEDTIESRCILCQRAADEGLTLSDETYANIEANIEAWRSSVAQLDLTLDEYFQIVFGPSIDETSYRKVSEVESLADEYVTFYYQGYQVPQIRYVFFPAADTAEQDVKDAASKAASEMKDACESDLDKLNELAETALNAGTDLNYGDLDITYEEFPLNLEEWAWSEERAVGDIDIVYEPELGYFIVGFLGTTADTEKGNAALFEEINADIEANTYDFHTDDPYLPAPAAPTVTPVPDGQTQPSSEVSFDPNSTNPTITTSVANQQHTMNSKDVIAVVLYTLAGVAVAAVVILLIAAAVKKSKNGAGASESVDDDEEDESEDDASMSDEDAEDDEDEEEEEDGE